MHVVKQLIIVIEAYLQGAGDLFTRRMSAKQMFKLPQFAFQALVFFPH